MSQQDQRAKWICASCGERHKENNPPCTKCAGEQFARLEDDSPQELEASETIRWQCKNCERVHFKNSPPCKECGHMQFETIRLVNESGRPPATTDEQSQNRQITVRGVIAYLFGFIAGAIGLLNVFFTGNFWGGSLIALSAAIALPYSRRRIENRLGVSFSTGAVILLVTILYFAGNILSIPYL